MSNKLMQYFPMLRTREEIQEEIQVNDTLRAKFSEWTQEQQSDFLDFCSGERGVRILYDPFFKEIMNPEYAPERLNELLSLLLGMDVHIMAVLPTDSTRLGSETSLVVMDIVVETAQGSLITVEVQKIGYMFPGQRGVAHRAAIINGDDDLPPNECEGALPLSACYSADLLLRQYKRLRDKKKKKFNYKDIKEVYTIVFYENSPSAFRAFPDTYLHYFEQQSDTGLKMDLLLKYLFIPLDIFQKTIHNKPVTNKLDAWLMFLSTDDPEDIAELIRNWPEFRTMYGEIYGLCRNTEKVMDMYSKELQELDRNTVEYMIDVMGEEIENLQSQNRDKQNRIEEQQGQIEEQKGQLAEQQGQLAEQQGQIEEQQSQIAEQQGQIAEQQGQIEEQQSQIAELERQVQMWKLRAKDWSEAESAAGTKLEDGKDK